ncbi:MAG: hypothetical protein HY072_04390 [Deltaproteobacteria bacterium]|nr:hypothetical protein [Deltaproteobacteria bacterium]
MMKYSTHTIVAIGMVIGCIYLIMVLQKILQSPQKSQIQIMHNIQKIAVLNKKETIKSAKTKEVQKTALSFVDRFTSLQEKLLKKSSDLLEYNALLSNRDQLTSVAQYLSVPPSEFAYNEQTYRLKLIDYLIESAKWQDNPAQSFAIDEINKLILTENITEDLPIEIRKSVAQDKVELFSALMKIDIETAKSVKNKALGTDIAQIISYAEQTFGDRD